MSLPHPVARAASHDFHLKHFSSPTWCKFCTKFIWGLGKQGYSCKACKYPVHTKCKDLVPPNCPNQIIRDPNSKKSITRDDNLANMNDLVGALMKGVEVKDRKVLLKTYPNSFVGSEAVDWMISHLPIRDRDEAVELGNKMISSKYIKHAVEPNKNFKDDEKSFYCFIDDVERTNLPNAFVGLAIGAIGGQKEKEGENAFNTGGLSEQDFEQIQVIGRGGFGKVVKVKKKGGDRVYAMKVMNKNKIASPKQLQCLIAEKNIMLNDNPFLVHLHYSFQSQDKLYFVMDYISGGDLGYHIERKGKFNEKEVRFITAEIVLGLEHLHSCGIVYRDLKLENILLDKEGHVCLTDFGLSKELDSISGTTKTVCGTPTYLAPEVLQNQPYSNAIDWWSLGVVLFELFTGSNPFDAKDFDSVMRNIMHGIVVVPETVPDSARNLINSLLQRDPKKRLCSGPTGSAEIQNHPFYKSIDWKKLMVKSVKPPFVPQGEENFNVDMTGGDAPVGKGNNALDLPDFNYATKEFGN